MKKNIISLFLISFLLNSCNSQSQNESLKHQLETYKVSSKKSCEQKDGYWYKDKCWANFKEVDSNITTANVDEEVDKQIEKFNTAKLYVNGNDYAIKMFFPDQSEDEIVFHTTYVDAEGIKTLITILPVKKIEEEKKFTAETKLFSGNLFGENVNYDEFFNTPIAFGKLKVVLNNVDNLELSFNGILKNKNDDAYKISYNTNESLLGIGDTNLRIEGAEVYLNGTLGTISYKQFKDLIKNHPEVKTVVLENVPGSMNDEINMHTGRIIHEAGLNTKILSNSQISSGGVDLFCAGIERTVIKGAKVGIHSWDAGDFTAADLPKDHPAHQYQVAYYTMCLGKKLGEDFYFRTLEAAPADGMHWMDDESIKKWTVATKFIND